MEKLVIPKQGPLTDLVKFANIPNVVIYNGQLPLTNIPRGPARDIPLGLSPLGTAVFSDLTLMGCSWSDTSQPQNSQGLYPIKTLADDRYRTGGAGNSVAGNNSGIGAAFYMNIPTVLIRVTQHYEVVTTKIQGAPAGAGEVDEYIGSENARINITGIITGSNGVYPRDEVKRLKDWLDAPVSKGIVCWWLGNLGIDNITVLDIEIPQVEGGYSQQPFKIDCKASYPVQLRITVPISNTTT